MKIAFARLARAAAIAACAAGLSVAAQTTPPRPTEPAQTQSQKGKGTVVFSRSTDENGNTTDNSPAALPAGQNGAAANVNDAERKAVAFTAFDLDVHLRPAEHQLAIRAVMTVRNDGKKPLEHLPLQISSSLNWESIRAGGKETQFQVAVVNSDADHTGRLREAEVKLADPLAPGASVQVDARYSGMIEKNAQRLTAIGTPEDVALHSDWDEIGADFTGLRGFGNVVWYPVASAPVLLGDGARLFDEMGEHKLRMMGAQFRLRLTIEFPHGQAPSIALINGRPVPLKITDAGSEDVASVATAEADSARLGFESPSMFVAIRKPHPGQNLTAWTVPDNEINAQLWLDAAIKVTPFLQGWLGQKPRAPLTLLDLPDRQDAPYETGALLAASLRDGPADQLENSMAHALTHAWMESPRAWLSEGVAHFMGTLWIEKQQGRDKALSALASGRNALALAEVASPGDGPGQPLARAISPVYYRTKAAYVLWMLRDLAGDAALSAALRAYDSGNDRDEHEGQGTGQQANPNALEKLMERATPGHDLGWFFADWVDADKGLPDLAVDSVFPTPADAGNTLVAVSLSNSGYAGAEVPVTVRSTETSITQRVRIPGRGKVTQRIVIQGMPTEVEVNDGTVPETEASTHVTKIGPPSERGARP